MGPTRGVTPRATREGGFLQLVTREFGALPGSGQLLLGYCTHMMCFSSLISIAGATRQELPLHGGTKGTTNGLH